MLPPKFTAFKLELTDQTIELISQKLNIPPAEAHRFYGIFKCVVEEEMDLQRLEQTKLLWLTRAAFVTQLVLPSVRSALVQSLSSSDELQNNLQNAGGVVDMLVTMMFPTLSFSAEERKQIIDILVALSRDRKVCNEELLAAMSNQPLELNAQALFIIESLRSYVAGMAGAVTNYFEPFFDLIAQNVPAMRMHARGAKAVAGRYVGQARDCADLIADTVKPFFPPAGTNPPTEEELPLPPDVYRPLRSFADLIRRLPEVKTLPVKESTHNFEAVKDHVEITLKDIDLSYEDLEALAHMAPGLQKLTLGENVRLNGSPFFDKEDVALFFKEGVAIEGVPNDGSKGQVKELLDYCASLGLTPAQMWTFHIMLKKEAAAWR